MQDKPLAGATVAFDLDGTLVDTAPDLLRALNETLSLEGLEAAPEAAVRAFVGHGARAMIERAVTRVGRSLSPQRLEVLTERFVEFYAADIARLSRPFPGAEAALDALSGLGARLCVCTNKRTGLSVRLLDALELSGRFAAIVGSDSVANRKPHPEHFREAVRQAGGDPGWALMVGDSAADVQAAKAAGAPCVFARFGYGPAAEAIDATAEFASYAELPGLAARLLSTDGSGGS